MTKANDGCIFCDALANDEQPTVFITSQFFVCYDNFPVNKGHMLIISRRHQPDVFSLTPNEWANLTPTLQAVKRHLDEAFHPDGYNIGLNCGEAAGQTIDHFHIHMIPRYQGDVENPRGGIRNFKTPLVQY